MPPRFKGKKEEEFQNWSSFIYYFHVCEAIHLIFDARKELCGLEINYYYAVFIRNASLSA